MEDSQSRTMKVTSKKMITTEKGDGTVEKKFKTTLSDGETQVVITSNIKNDLVHGESISMTLKQNQKTLIDIKS